LPFQVAVSEDGHLDGICILMLSQESQDLFVFVLPVGSFVPSD